MSKKLDDLDLEVIQELAKRSQKAQDLILEKTKALKEIEQGQNPTFKKPDPAPKPKSDIRINKRHQKETMSNETKDTIIENVKSDYNEQIKEALSEKAIQVDKETIYPLVEQMDKDDLSTLVERGKQAFKERINQKEKELKASLELDIDTMDNSHEEYPILLDFENNREDMDKATSPEDDFE